MEQNCGEYCEQCGDCLGCYPHDYCETHQCCEMLCLGKPHQFVVTETSTNLIDKLPEEN